MDPPTYSSDDCGYAMGKVKTQYTGLRNDLFRSFDLSELVPQYAVLFGCIDQPTASLRLNGESIEPGRYSGFVRLVLPVTRQSTVKSQLMDLRSDAQKADDERRKALAESQANGSSPSGDQSTDSVDKPKVQPDKVEPEKASPDPEPEERDGDVSVEPANEKSKEKP